MRPIIIALFSVLLSLNATAQDQEKMTKSDRLYEQIKGLFEADMYKDVLELSTEALEATKNANVDKEKHAYILFFTAQSYLATGSNLEALNYFKLFLEEAEQFFNKESDKYLMPLIVTMTLYKKLGKYEIAINFAKEKNALIISKNNEDANLIILECLASCNYELKNYEEAFDLEWEASLLLEKKDKKSEQYENSLSILIHISQTMNNVDKEQDVLKKYLSLIEEKYGKKSNDYFYALVNLSDCLELSGKYQESLYYANTALQIINETPDLKNKKNYAIILTQLASLQYHLGNYDLSLNHAKEALQITKTAFGETSDYYIKALLVFASNNKDIGNYSDAIIAGEKALKILANDKENEVYILVLNILGNCHLASFNYDKALEYLQEAKKIIENRINKDKQRRNYWNEHYASVLSSLSLVYRNLYYIKTEDIKKENYLFNSYNLATESVNIFRNLPSGSTRKEYITSLTNLATIEISHNNNLDSALFHYNEALHVANNIISNKHPFYATILYNIGCVNSLKNEYTEANEKYKEALDIIKESLGEEHSMFAIICSDLILNNYYLKNRTKVKNYSNLFFKITPKIIKKNFATLKETERNAFWTEHSVMFLEFIHQLAFYLPSSSIIKNACDAILMGKGLLLSTSQEMNKLIADSGDSETIKLYDELRMNRLILDQLYKKPVKERLMSTDSLEQVANNLERQLIDKSTAYGDYTRNLLINTDSVQNAMKPNDVAVEFVSFPLNQDSTMYVAYVIKKNNLFYVPLFEEKQLKAKQSNSNNYMAPANIYKQELMASELIWKQLAQYLDGAENIYFAPSGELYNIAIESLPDWDNPDRLMSERWPGLCRVSSTREIAITHDHEPITSSVTYGGLKYGMSVDFLVADANKYGNKANDNMITLKGFEELKGTISTWKDMPITLDEANAVHKSLTDASISDTPYLEQAGTEASFKALSGLRKNMMFLSTHGFFWNNEEAAKKRKEHTLQFIALGDDNQKQAVEDVALTHSGLVFSGANYAWNNNELPEGVDDGFLTAKEISQLDLRGLGLVVLSACQTGLGDVSGEGVFGLQRGFKKAGAQSLLMSLWEVEATSTKLLMTEFCKNVFQKKMPKRQALRAAQQTVKAIPKFNDPYYWAGFILLDALD